MSDAGKSFISGLDLSEAFYQDLIEPIMRENFPELSYAAALIGSGSEVLGFDTEMSTDHHWGPRVMLFLHENDLPVFEPAIDKKVSEKLPRRFRGYPTSYVPADGPSEAPGILMLDYSKDGPIRHRVSITSFGKFIQDCLGFDLCKEISARDWLSFPEQKLLSISAGKIFHDGIELTKMREKFAYYPHDLWLYLLAAGWSRIEQEEHLMGRAGSSGDELGSAIIAGRLVRDLMRLCFLMEKRYAPYPKWFGTAFKKLAAAEALEPALAGVLSAKNWQDREDSLVQAYEYLARQHNRLDISEPLPESASQFHGRPFRVISMGAFSSAICARISDPCIKKIAERPLIGSIDQFSDSTDLLADTCWREAICRLYE